MDTLLQDALDRIKSRVDFQLDTIEGPVVDLVQKSFNLADKTVALKASAAAAGVDPIDAAKNVREIAEVLGESKPKMDADRVARTKTAMKGVIKEADPAYEAALEAYFEAELDLENGFVETIQAVDQAIEDAGSGN